MRVPKTLLVLACLSGLAFGLVHVLGWRADTAFLAGNAVTAGAAGRGVLYVVLWLQAVVLAPTLTLAAGIAAVLGRLGRRSRRHHDFGSEREVGRVVA